MWPFNTCRTISLDELRSSYDYIIVGGGTAGCVLASRLSEDPSVTVLLLERGKTAFTWASWVPLLSSDYQSDGTRSQKTASVPQRHVADKVTEIVVGNALGGTSRINGMIYTWGLPAQFNAWEEQGRKGWSYGDLHPYFRKAERALDEQGTSKIHNTSGEWRNRSHAQRFFQVFIRAVQAAKGIGFPFITDLNSDEHPIYGIAKLHYTIDEHGRRNHAASAFLPETLLLKRKENLHVCVDALVTRLLSDRSEENGLVVAGVHVENSQRVSAKVSANNEVVLCAGSLGTPQLLMLSGIGPREHLASAGIEVIKDLPGVGSNLQDHIGIPILFNVPLEDSILSMQRRPWVALREFFKYWIFGTGMLLCPVHELSLFAKSELLSADFQNGVADPTKLDRTDPANIPDIEIMTSILVQIAYGETRKEDGHRGGFSLWAIPVSPASRGTVRLASSDPRVPVACDPNLLADPTDRASAHAGMRLCLRIKERMAENGYPITDYAVPGGTAAEALDRHIVQWGQSIYHYTSTCRMAPEGDIYPGVVDDELRVHGVRGLRIADASIFPNVLATHLQASVVAVAEKCADMLKTARKAEIK
ncbi:alcohol oxidase [Hysterangium stoloniferum]|nr:alcohol oxidase [Hysterangium stoloniferum]